MKTYLLTIIMSLSFIHGYSQWTQSGSNITTTNNVGVGTAAPDSKLEIVSSGVTNTFGSKPSLLVKDLTKRGVIVLESLSDEATSFIFKTNNRYSWQASSRPSGSDYSLIFNSSVNGTDWVTPAVLTLKTDGKVGIGISAPSSLLDVNGDIKARENVIISRGYRITTSLTDNFTYDGKNMGQYSIKWDSDSWNNSGATLLQSGWGGIKFFTGSKARLVIDRNGNIGIGSENPQYALDVNGTICAKEIKVEITAGADHVFSSNYRLKPLDELETFIVANRHLPEIPTEKQMQENGLNINEFQVKLLQKVEELTLYVINLKKENDNMQKQIKEQEKQIQELKK